MRKSTSPAVDWFACITDWPDLPDGATVVEVGGYEGLWATAIAQRYGARLFVFEPQEWAYQKCIERLAGMDAKIFNYGLGDRDVTYAPMTTFRTDGATFADREGDGESLGRVGYGHIRDINAVWTELGWRDIDLMQVNCEGCEFKLLPYLLRLGLLSHIRRLIVQFHPYSAAERILEGELREQISKTHRVLWAGAHTAWEAMAWGAS